jgi:hypothetical protein
MKIAANLQRFLVNNRCKTYLQRFLVENHCKVANKYCCPSYKLSLSPNQQPPPLKELWIWAFLWARNNTKFHQIWSNFLLSSLAVSTTNFSQTKWVTEADRSGWLERVQSGQRQAGPRQHQTRSGSNVQWAAASVKVNFWNL